MTNNTERKAFDGSAFLDELMGEYDFTLPAKAYCKLRAALSQREQVGEWVMVEDALPPFVEGKDTSDNVLAVYKSWNEKLYVSIFRREIVEWDDDGSFTYTWAKMSGMYYDLHSAECEWDDDYTVIKWMPIPSPELSAAPAPSLCTAEEAAFEVTPEDADEWPSVTDGMQEQIDNALDADRAKR